MRPLSERKIIFIWRKSRLDELVSRHNTREQARFQMNSAGGHFEELLEEDKIYKAVLEKVTRELQCLGRVQTLERNFLPSFIFGPDDIVVVVGQDGLVANTLKYLRGQPLIAINPDPSRIQGVLLPFTPTEATGVVRATISGKVGFQNITMAEATTNDGQYLLAVNDFFIGIKGHTSARYRIDWNGYTEYQSSSGIIISTGLGNSGWMKSVILGAVGVCRAAGLQSPELSQLTVNKWDSPTLNFYVREPFPGRAENLEVIFGQINHETPVTLHSDMAEKGVLFSDGMEDDMIVFNAGMSVRVGIAAQQGKLIY